MPIFHYFISFIFFHFYPYFHLPFYFLLSSFFMASAGEIPANFTRNGQPPKYLIGRIMNVKYTFGKADKLTIHSNSGKIYHCFIGRRFLPVHEGDSISSLCHITDEVKGFIDLVGDPLVQAPVSRSSTVECLYRIIFQKSSQKVKGHKTAE